MSYYQRPMGDYKTYGYAGDPGFLSDLWKGVKKVAAPILGTAIGGPIGGLIGGALGGGKAATPPIKPSFPGLGQGFQVAAPPGWKFPPSPPGAGARGPSMPGFQYPSTDPRSSNYAIASGQRPCGYHPAKDGSGRWVRNRRMNVANPRALRKAMRRVQGFEKLARRTITFTRRTRMKKRKSS